MEIAVKATVWISPDLIGQIKAVFLAASLPRCIVSSVVVWCSLISIKTYFLKGILVTQSQKDLGELVEGIFFSVISMCLYSNRTEIFGSSVSIQICFIYVSMEHSTQIQHFLIISTFCGKFPKNIFYTSVRIFMTTIFEGSEQICLYT